MSIVPVLASLLLSAATPPTRPSAPRIAAAPIQSGPRRQLVITDDNAGQMFDINVKVGVPTTLTFEIPIREDGVVLANVSGLFHPPQTLERAVILVPKKDPSRGTTTLNVTLSDGTMIPFRLLGGRQPDLQVDVIVQLQQKAIPDSVAALKATVAQMRAQLDECQSTTGDAGLAKIASLIIAQDLSKSQAFTVEQRALHVLDKQQRLLVQVRHAYRLFGYTYLVITIQNRDPAKIWVLDRPELKSTSTEIRVASFQSDLPSLPPSEETKLVVVFATPSQTPGQRVTLTLVEKNGSRHVTLDGVEL